MSEVGEVDTVRIEGALNLPLSRLRELADRLDRSAPVYLLCRSDSRAASAAGLLVFTGVVLGLTINRLGFALSGLVSAGLMFSAATDTCAMALVLARLPGNRGSCGK